MCIYIYSFSLGRAVAGCFLTVLLPLPFTYALLLQINLPSLRLLVCLHLLLISHVTVMSQNAESLHLLFLQSGSHGAQTRLNYLMQWAGWWEYRCVSRRRAAREKDASVCERAVSQSSRPGITVHAALCHWPDTQLVQKRGGHLSLTLAMTLPCLHPTIEHHGRTGGMLPGPRVSAKSPHRDAGEDKTTGAFLGHPQKNKTKQKQ